MHNWNTVSFALTRFTAWEGARRWNHLVLWTSKGLVVREVRFVGRWSTLYVYVFLIKLWSILRWYPLHSSNAMFIKQCTRLIQKLILDIFTWWISLAYGKWRGITRRLTTRLFLLRDYEVNILVLYLFLCLNDSLNAFLLKNSQAHFKQFQLRFQLFE